MSSKTIRNRARADLIVINGQGEDDPFLWEHSLRVLHNAVMIATLAEVRQASPDPITIEAAALYHDSGWVARLRSNEINRMDVLIRPVSSTHFDQGAMLLEERLRDVISRDSLMRASQAVRSLGARETSQIEARILAEANNLDEFGALSLWPNIRRGLLDGRGVQSVIVTWRRQKEFRFWEARLSNSFRFGAVRAIAEERLRQYDRFMRELEEQIEGRDVRFEGSAVGSDRAMATPPKSLG